VPNLSKQLGLEKESYNLLDNCKLYLLGQFSLFLPERIELFIAGQAFLAVV
jgi:hypothetical protein